MYLTFICALASVVDGDTIRCANAEEQNGRVRLARINAPEMRRPGGEESKAALQAMITGPVTCEHVDANPRKEGFQEHDPYGRVVARCSVAGRDLGEAMIEAGLRGSGRDDAAHVLSGAAAAIRYAPRAREYTHR